MGIQGLLPLLKSIETDVNLSHYAGQTIGVDISCWLHKGAFGCALELAQNIHTKSYVNYVMHRIHLMKHFRITPFVVFDGSALPMKKVTNDERNRRREENISKGKELLRAGKKTEALEYFRRATTVTSEMTTAIAENLRQENVLFVFAPYEADAQLAFLCKQNIISAVISEDSDLLVYGCKKIIYKMDRDGNGKEIQFQNLHKVKGMDLSGWDEEDLQKMCILSGCDYLPSLQGVGLKTAYKLLKTFKTVERVLAQGRKFHEDYKKDFRKAMQTFRHQRVFDPASKSIVSLHPLPADLQPDQLDFLGPLIPASIAEQIACGHIEASTRKPKLSSHRLSLPSSHQTCSIQPAADSSGAISSELGKNHACFSHRPKAAPIACASPSLQMTRNTNNKLTNYFSALISSKAASREAHPPSLIATPKKCPHPPQNSSSCSSCFGEETGPKKRKVIAHVDETVEKNLPGAGEKMNAPQEDIENIAPIVPKNPSKFNKNASVFSPLWNHPHLPNPNSIQSSLLKSGTCKLRIGLQKISTHQTLKKGSLQENENHENVAPNEKFTCLVKQYKYCGKSHKFSKNPQ